MNNSSFDHLTDDEIEAHLGVTKYGAFELTDAVRPSYDLKVRPSQGYRYDVYIDEENRTKVPVIMAAATRTRLFDVFMKLIEPLGQNVDVVLETSHEAGENEHVDLYREHIDMPVLKSILWDYEDLLLNDGCTGIAVLNPGTPKKFNSTSTSCCSCTAVLWNSTSTSWNLTPSAVTSRSNSLPKPNTSIRPRTTINANSMNFACDWAWTFDPEDWEQGRRPAFLPHRTECRAMTADEQTSRDRDAID